MVAPSKSAVADEKSSDNALFKEICEKEGYRAHPEQMGLLMPIYVAETDARAREEYQEHFWYFQKNLIPGLTLESFWSSVSVAW